MNKIKVSSSINSRKEFSGLSLKMNLTGEEYVRFMINQSGEFSDDESFMKVVFCKIVYLSRGGLFKTSELIKSLDYKSNSIRTCLSLLVKRGLIESSSWGIYRVLKHDVDDSYKESESIVVKLDAKVDVNDR